MKPPRIAPKPAPRTATMPRRTVTTLTSRTATRLPGTVAVLLVLAASALAADMLQPVGPADANKWSWSMIISAVERRSRSSAAPPSVPGTAAAAVDADSEMAYQLIDNLPTVVKKAGRAASLRPEPERCERCRAGTRPQPDGAGRVNSLVHKFEGAGAGAGAASRALPALPGQFPWHVSLLYRHWYFSCSGSLLSDEWVLTAANCVHGFDSIEVRLGSYRPGLENERFRTTVTCTQIAVHPGYRKGCPKDDIAVLRLPHPARLNGYTLPVRLPSHNSFLTTYAGRRAWLSGWGVTSKLGRLPASASLGYVEETVLPNERCAATFGDETTSATLCTTTAGFSTSVVGDSGAALVVDEGGFFVQIGVLTFAPSTGFADGGAAGFTRITSYSRWIQNATGLAPGPDTCLLE